jgi:hypothetical protein
VLSSGRHAVRVSGLCRLHQTAASPQPKLPEPVPTSSWSRAAIAALVTSAQWLADDAVARADPPAPSEGYFYKGYDYGTQSLYGPIYAMVSRGFDTLQLRSSRTMVVSMTDTRNVLDNVADPLTAIRYDGESGWGTFLETEIFPFSYGKNTARWIPNYGLHLLGGGQTYAWLREWFLAHDAPEAAATIFSIASLFTAALINESIENKGVVGYNTDAIADLYVFDVGGVILFSFEAVRKFFSKTLILSDWSLQPAITFPRGDLHNVGSYYSLKVPVPFVDRLRLFVYGGIATMGGLSYKLDDEYSVSAAAGGRTSSFENSGGSTHVENVVQFRPAGALFLDRNESLLAMVQLSDVVDYFFTVNVYPNAFFHTEPGLGTWTVIGKDGRWLAGLSFTHAFGVGFGLGTR